ncbi:unnamed protein product [Arabidopsis arenosa]|uniref:Uncharacterized protein n=1 Tax=Arabidopsis arenosa TaxID=38785 RepID=A0A8S2B2W9_ARAAE|nr:unnamed protein product [Arabidopsis arenosa]
MCRRTRASAVPIVADSEGTDTNPYSLDALAVFMFRVLQRVNHPGKLDKESSNAGYVLLMFYHLYEGKNRSEFESELIERFGSLIKMPLLKSDRTPLPDPVKSVLEEGIDLFNLHNRRHGRLYFCKLKGIVVTMFLTRFVGRRFLAAASARSESTTTAAASAIRTPQNPLEEFFEFDRSQDEDKLLSTLICGNFSLLNASLHCFPKSRLLATCGLFIECRGWKASELRLKSWDDLQKLWYVLLKEKNMLMTQRQMLQAQNMQFPNPERIPKVRRSMCRIKHVLIERAIEEPDPRRSAEMKRMVNGM